MKGVARKIAKAEKATTYAEPNMVAATPPTARSRNKKRGIMANKGAIASNATTTAAMIVSQTNTEAYRTSNHHYVGSLIAVLMCWNSQS